MSMATISQNERDVVQLLMEHESCSIADLEGYLNVTATAVRQRIHRLMSAGLVDRKAESVGRGRPSHRYRLTQAGRKAGGNNLEDFAEAMWHEIKSIPDDNIRRQIISGVAHRLASAYASEVDGRTVEDRLNSVAKLFGQRDIPVVVEKREGLPVLKILSCPYPELADENHDFCEMEKQLFSEVIGGSFDLCQCRQDGDSCCSFQQDSAQ